MDVFFCVKHKTAYEMRISDWSSDVCSSDLFSGGLHGVGVSVTNALSKRLEVRVWRDGATHELIFAGGEVLTPLQELEPVGRRKTGTRVRVWPDPKYFDTAAIPMAELVHALRSKAVLLTGKIGRASCRERVCQSVSMSVVAGPLKKKT